jgi:hypothetical protein
VAAEEVVVVCCQYSSCLCISLEQEQFASMQSVTVAVDLQTECNDLGALA